MPGTALAERPRCINHGRYMELRPLAWQTREQRWCGIWYDCPEWRCWSSTLYPSHELLLQNAAMLARSRP